MGGCASMGGGTSMGGCASMGGCTSMGKESYKSKLTIDENQNFLHIDDVN